MKLHIRRFVPALTVGTLLTFVLSASATADTIVLKSGQKIEGQVLKVQEDVIFVDIGIDVIKVPVDSIDKRMEDDAKEEATVEGDDSSAIAFQFSDMDEYSMYGSESDDEDDRM